MTHVPVPRHLRVPAVYAGAVASLQLHDPDLRLRRSLEQPHYYVLERRCRRVPPSNAGMFLYSDRHLQARDGYIHVALVHPSFLAKPWNMIRALQHEGADIWAKGGAAKFTNELEYEEAWATETRRRRRLGLYRDIATDAWHTLNRMNIGGERSRIQNVGVVAHAP